MPLYEIIVTVDARDEIHAEKQVNSHMNSSPIFRGASSAREVPLHPFTGKPVSAAQRDRNGQEVIRWYQTLTRTSDPVMLRRRMEAQGLLSADNDPHLIEEPKP